VYASSDWLDHIRESRSVANSQPSESYVHVEARLKSRIIECKPVFHPHIWEDLSDAQVLVNSLLVQNYLLRATASSALQSQWINSEMEELEALYERRITDTLGDTA